MAAESGLTKRTSSCLLMGCSGSQTIEQRAKFENAASLQVWIVSDVEPIEVNVFHARKFETLLFAQQSFQVGLAQLIASARCAAPKLDAVPAQSRFDPVAQSLIGAPKNERESIIAASFGGEVGLVLVRIEVFQEGQQMLGAAAVIIIQPLELVAPHDGIQLGTAHVPGGKRENEIRIEVRIFLSVLLLDPLGGRFPDHAVRAQHAQHLI